MSQTRSKALTLLKTRKNPATLSVQGIELQLLPLTQRQFASYQAATANGERLSQEQADVLIANVRDNDGNKVFEPEDIEAILETHQTEFVGEILDKIGELASAARKQAKNSQQTTT